MSVERYKYYGKFSFRRDIIAVCAEMMDKWDLWDGVDETAISTLVASFKRKKHWGLFFIPRLPIKLIFCSSCMEGFTESRGLQHRGNSTACLKMGLEMEQKGRSLWWRKKKWTIKRHKYTFLASTDFPRQAVSIPVPIASPSAVIARSLTPVPDALAARRFAQFNETNHSSCPCKHSSYFHSSSPSKPVWQTAASDHKHKCTLTCTEAHSGNKSSAFLWFSCLRPKSFRVWCCASFPLCTHIYFTVLYTSTYVQWWNGTKCIRSSTLKLFKVLWYIYFNKYLELLSRSRYLNSKYLELLIINFPFSIWIVVCIQLYTPTPSQRQILFFFTPLHFVTALGTFQIPFIPFLSSDYYVPPNVVIFGWSTGSKHFFHHWCCHMTAYNCNMLYNAQWNATFQPKYGSETRQQSVKKEGGRGSSGRLKRAGGM